MRGATPPRTKIGPCAGSVRGDIIAAFMRGLRHDPWQIERHGLDTQKGCRETIRSAAALLIYAI